MDVKKILSELGLTKTKADVYLAALQVGVGSAEDISIRAGIPRTTCFEIMQYLSSLGLASYTNKGRKRIYTVEKPNKLQKLLNEKEKRLNAVLPELLSLYNTAGVRPKVRIYEGVEGIKTIFEDTLTTQDKKLFGILSMEDLYEIPGKKFMDDYVERRIVTGISLYVLRSQQKEVGETWPSSEKEKRELRYATQNLIFPMTVYMYDNKVSVIGTKKERFGMIIESQDFYLTFKNLFDVMWQVSKITKKAD